MPLHAAAIAYVQTYSPSPVPDLLLAPPVTNETNNYYGGTEPRGSNIYFSDFSDDPWQQASVRRVSDVACPTALPLPSHPAGPCIQEVSPELPYQLVECDGCGHCDDLRAPSSSDPAALTASRKRFADYLTKWLQ